MSKFSSTTIIIIVIVVILLIILNPFVIVPPGNVGVKVFLGKVYPRVLHNGFHIVFPLVKVVKMDVRLQAYTMSIATAEGEIRGDDAIEALTSEGLKVKLDITAWYRLIPEEAATVYQNIGPDYVVKIVRPSLRTAIRDIVVGNTAEEIYSAKRDEIVSKIQEHSIILSEGKGIEIDKILLRNVKLPEKIENAIDAKISADQDAQKMEFVLLKEKSEKERKIIEAEGIREANYIISKSLTTNYIRWYRVEMLKQLVNSPNNTIIIIPEELKSAPIMIPSVGN